MVTPFGEVDKECLWDALRWSWYPPLCLSRVPPMLRLPVGVVGMGTSTLLVGLCLGREEEGEYKEASRLGTFGGISVSSSMGSSVRCCLGRGTDPSWRMALGLATESLRCFKRSFRVFLASTDLFWSFLAPLESGFLSFFSDECGSVSSPLSWLGWSCVALGKTTALGMCECPRARWGWWELELAGVGEEGRNWGLLADELDSLRDPLTFPCALSHWFLMGCRPFCWSTGVDSGVGRAANSGGWHPSRKMTVLVSPLGAFRSLPVLRRLVYNFGESLLVWYS